MADEPLELEHKNLFATRTDSQIGGEVSPSARAAARIMDEVFPRVGEWRARLLAKVRDIIEAEFGASNVFELRKQDLARRTGRSLEEVDELIERIERA